MLFNPTTNRITVKLFCVFLLLEISICQNQIIEEFDSSKPPPVVEVAYDVDAWETDSFCFIGSFQPYLDPPEYEGSLSSCTLANDEDKDGVWVHTVTLPPGSYDTTVVNNLSKTKNEFHYRHFEVVGGGNMGASSVTFFFDRRENVVDVSVNFIPIVCGDFMVAAGYYSAVSNSSSNANWNPTNMLGWLKDVDGRRGIQYRTHLHVPFGQWHYKICFHGYSIDECVGTTGSDIPISIDVLNVDGANVVFTYEASSQKIVDSLGNSNVGKLPSPPLPLFSKIVPSVFTTNCMDMGARSLLSLAPVASTELGTWVGREVSFRGSYGPARSPPVPAYSADTSLASDEDGDGIAELRILVSSGTFFYVPTDMVTQDMYNAFGVLTPFNFTTIQFDHMPAFTVPEREEGGGSYSNVTLYFDWRDNVAAASVDVMPVLCGDFMAGAGYFSSSVGREGANWNPNNLLGWMKSYDGGTVYQVFLKLPYGFWKYKICFRGSDLSESIGVGGSQFPFLVDITNPDGMSVGFTYDASTHTVANTLSGAFPSLLPRPMLTAPLGDQALTPFNPASMGAWTGRLMSFFGNDGPSRSPPVAAYDHTVSLATDTDGDGITELHILVSAGTYFYVAMDAITWETYDLFGISKPFDTSSFAIPEFTVPEPEGGGFLNVTLYHDWRDHMVAASVDVIPVLCGDFMADAGYFGPSVGAEGANWNPDNMLGWMKSYDGSSAYQIFLHVPQGVWKYKICFHSKGVGESIGVGGSQFPHTVLVENANGADVTFVYDATTGAILDSLGGAFPSLLPRPMLTAPLGDQALTPFNPASMAAWTGRLMSFFGSDGPARSPPVAAYDPSVSLATDTDGDGITELHILISSGTYFYVAMDAITWETFDLFGISKPFDTSSFAIPEFTVPEPEGGGFMNVTLYHDWRDHMVAASVDVIPVLCGDFMADAGYFGPSVGAEGANWNPDNMIGWMKSYDASPVHQIFLHVPEGVWKYKICFRGNAIAESIGVGGSQFPHSIAVKHADGADVTFTYDSATHSVSDSLGGTSPLVLSSPMLTAPLGDQALTPFNPASMGAWTGRLMSFFGNDGPSRSPPVASYDHTVSLATDTDGDGITELHILISAGTYFYVAMDVITWETYDLFGISKPFDTSSFAIPEFTVPETEGWEFMSVTLYHDWRDHMVAASVDVIPVLCGDFMADAGYFGPSVGAEGANWNPDNLLGWMKDYDQSGVFQTFLHVPEGEWHYQVCFRGVPLDERSIGFGGKPELPLTLVIPSTGGGGSDVTFLYDANQGIVVDSLTGFPPLSCHLDCGKHGECVGSNTCTCDLGYVGDLCEFATHFMIGDSARCASGWTGVQCTLPDHCAGRDGQGNCVEGCESGWSGGVCEQRLPMGGGGGYGLDLGDRANRWAVPPLGARARSPWRGGLSADLTVLSDDWKCSLGVTPFSALKTMETWVYLFPYSSDYGPSVMPLLSLGVYQWGLQFVAPATFRQHLVFGNRFLSALQVNTGTGQNLKGGAFPVYEGEVNTWVHVALVLTPDDSDDGNLELTSYINGDFEFSSKSTLSEIAPTEPEGLMAKTVRIGNFHHFTASAETSQQQWLRPLLDEFRLWTKPQSGWDIMDRLHRPLTSAELAWSDESEFPDCFFYLPFVPENFKTPHSFIGGQPGNYYLPFQSSAPSTNSEHLIVNRAGGEDPTFTGPLYTELAVDTGEAVPSSAPVGGGDHIVVGDADVPVTFQFPVLAAPPTLPDALVYPILTPLSPPLFPPSARAAAEAATGLDTSDAVIRLTSVTWQQKRPYEGLGGESVRFAGTVQLGAYNTTIRNVSMVAEAGAEAEAEVVFPATTDITVTLSPGNWSDVNSVDDIGRERVLPVLRLGYTATVAGLTSAEAFVLVQILPPSVPVVGPSGKALRCNGAGPLGAERGEFRNWRQWASADVELDFTPDNPVASEGVTLELWFLSENLEGQQDLLRLQARLIYALGGGGATSPAAAQLLPMSLGHVLTRIGGESTRVFSLGLRYQNPMRSWTHLAVHITPGPGAKYTGYINGELSWTDYLTNVLPIQHRGLFLCGRPGFVTDDESPQLDDVDAITSGLEGAIDEVRIWRGERTKRQIHDWMFRTLERRLLSPAEQDSLIAHWDFEDDGVTDDGRVLDRSGNNHDLVPGGCHVPVEVASPPACAGRTDVTPDPAHIPTTYYPQPESPVTIPRGVEVEVGMGEWPEIQLEGYDPAVMRCPHTPPSECRDFDEARLPRFHLTEFPPSSGPGAASCAVMGGNDPGTGVIEFPGEWSTSTYDAIRIQPLSENAGGRPFTTLAYRLESPVAGLASSDKHVTVNIRCAPGHYLDQDLLVCVGCPAGTYRQDATFEPGCCDIGASAQEAGCFVCDPGFMMVPDARVAGTVACVLPPCGEYETQVILADGSQECVPSFDLPSLTRTTLGVLALVVLGGVGGVVVWVVKNRRTRVVVNSSRPFLFIMLLGLGLVTISVLLLIQPQTPSLCFWKTISFHVGFSLMFGSAVAKTWRLHRIFNNKRLVRVNMHAQRFYPVVGMFVAFDVAVMGFWEYSDPVEVRDELQKVCESDSMDAFVYALVLSKAVLMVWGCWLAYKVRHLPSSFNESQGITLALNNVTVMGALTLGVTSALGKQLEEGGVIKIVTAVCGLIGVLACVVCIFVPKFKAAADSRGAKNNQQTGSGTVSRRRTFTLIRGPGRFSNLGGTKRGGTVDADGGAGGEHTVRLVKKREKLKEIEGQVFRDKEQLASIHTSIRTMEEEVKKLEQAILKNQDEVEYMRQDPGLRGVAFTSRELGNESVGTCTVGGGGYGETELHATKTGGGDGPRVYGPRAVGAGSSTIGSRSVVGGRAGAASSGLGSRSGGRAGGASSGLGDVHAFREEDQSPRGGYSDSDSEFASNPGFERQFAEPSSGLYDMTEGGGQGGNKIHAV